MKKINVKSAFFIMAAAFSFASTSTQAMPITSSGSIYNSYLSAANKDFFNSYGVSEHQTSKVKNITLEALGSLLKNISIKKDDFTINVAFNKVSDFPKSTDKDQDVKTSKVPEPSSLLLLALGVFGIAGLRKKKFN